MGELRLPRFLKTVLRPVYRLVRPGEALKARDWNLDIAVPEEERDAFLRSVMAGKLDHAVRNDRLSVLLCAQPKSASLYITQLLSHCLGLRNHQIGFDEKGGRIYWPRLLAAKFTGENTISHCHAEPDPDTLKMIASLDLRPVVLTRNLLDALVSRRDMLVRDRWTASLLSKGAVEAFAKASSEVQMDVVIELFAHIYINFQAGWSQHRDDEAMRPIYITYGDLIDDETAMVERVAKGLGVEVSRERIRDVSAKISKAGGINFSTGVVGRGRGQISDRQIEVLREKAGRLGCRDETFLGFEL